MRITRLYLRNYRVYEQELELEMPAGLVGIYGPNGAGKSALIESLLWTLWGRSRTRNEDVRTTGVGADCITEVEFEHEGHLYQVRRTITGINSTVKAEAWADRMQVASGVRDVKQYVHSVLGMDDAAFRASVFAEQKQIAAFSSHKPAERRDLVLRLLGITPLDAARDAARRDAKAARDDVDRVRGFLPDLDLLRPAVEQAAAAAVVAASDASSEEVAAATARAAWDQAEAAFVTVDEVRQEYEALVREGKGARAAAEDAAARVAALESELAGLSGVAEELASLAEAAAAVDPLEEELRLVEAVVRAAVALARVPEPAPVGSPPDDEALAAAQSAASAAKAALDEVAGGLRAAAAEVTRAEAQLARSADLSAEGDCPVCGQELGDAFVSVQHHREQEVAEARQRVAALEGERASLTAAASAAADELRSVAAAHAAASEAVRAFEQARQQRAVLEAALDEAVEALVTAWPERYSDEESGSRVEGGDASESSASPAEGSDDGGMSGSSAEGGDASGPGPGRRARRRPTTALAGGRAISSGERILARRLTSVDVDGLRAALHEARAAVRRSGELAGALQRKPVAEAQLADERDRLGQAEGRRTALLEKVKALGFEPAKLDAARQSRDEAKTKAALAAAAADQARLEAQRKQVEAEAEARRLAEAEAQHEALAERTEDARHLGRMAELMNSFRTNVVATVGPQLSAQAAELFAELTDNEYDLLQVDSETYEIQIMDRGRSFGMERFSGSETDLANLALRVAISEHVRFQSGGAVGLLVLDEVFGPLDDERKERMLLALERLRARFGQVLVVTHDKEIKEQLPSAIEVTKLPGRRATAKVRSGV